MHYFLGREVKEFKMIKMIKADKANKAAETQKNDITIGTDKMDELFRGLLMQNWASRFFLLILHLILG